MHEVVIPTSNDQLGFSGHARMNRVARQKPAENTVIGIGWQTADHVAGIDVF